MHPWHDIDPHYDGELTFRALIEIPKGDKNKYELDKETGLLKIDRILHTSMIYPANYGMIPRSLCDDGDPLDVLVLAQLPIFPMTIVKCRAIGVMRMLDQNELDDKIIAVHVKDPEYASYKNIRDLPPHRMLEIAQFFREYSSLEKEKTLVKRPQGTDVAKRILQQNFADYAAAFKGASALRGMKGPSPSKAAHRSRNR